MTKNSELTEYDILDAERLVVKYAYEGNGLAKEVELENFEVVRIDECMTTIEIQALVGLMEDDNNYDLDFEEFYINYIIFSGQIKTKQVLSDGKKLKSDIDKLAGD